MGRRRTARGSRLRLFRQHNLALLNEQSPGAHVECAIRAVEKMLLKFMTGVGIELTQQVSFRHFLTSHYVVVHRCNAPS
jgi:hypothetical protein